LIYDIPSWLSEKIQVDEVKHFYVVTYPTKYSELVDICFKSTVPGIMLQCKGGLEIEDIAGIFTAKDRAERFAKRLLSWV
jgi:hypothetical protein